MKHIEINAARKELEGHSDAYSVLVRRMLDEIEKYKIEKDLFDTKYTNYRRFEEEAEKFRQEAINERKRLAELENELKNDKDRFRKLYGKYIARDKLRSDFAMFVKQAESVMKRLSRGPYVDLPDLPLPKMTRSEGGHS